MDTYRTEEEQIEALRNWWKENGKSTVLGVVLAVAGVFGYRVWEAQQGDLLAEAAGLYQQLLEADAQAIADPTQRATARHLAERLQTDYKGQAYARYAGLFLAKYAAQAGDWAAAEAALKSVLATQPEPALRAQVEVRLAKALFAAGRGDEALRILDEVAEGPSRALADELEGDIHFARGDQAAALSAWRAARERLAETDGSSTTLLDMKIAELEAAQPEAEA